MYKSISGKKLVKFLSKTGFSIYSRKGSHVKMINFKRKVKTIIPMHKEIATGTLNSILKQVKLTEKEIKELMKDF